MIPENLDELRSKAREFAIREFTEDRIRKYEEEEKYPEEIRRKAFEAGFLNMNDPWGMLVAMEEFCRVDPGLGISALSAAFGSEVIMLFGSDYLKRKYLEPVLRGEKISGFAVTEPSAGSDVAGIKSRLERRGKGWILNGEKIFITNGTVADHFYVLARSSPPPSPEKRHHGMTMVVVESSWPGFEATQMKGKLGMRATSTAHIKFHDVEVPEENVIGEEGKGFYYVMTFFDISRIHVATQALGIAQGALDSFVEYVVSNGLGNRESYQFAIAEAATRVHAARLLTYDAADRLFRFSPDPVRTSMAKYFAGETAVHVTDLALRYTGLRGLTSRLEKFYRDAKIEEIWEGTNEVEKLVISRMLLKGKR
ncbi:acyl-CoA dehydrogenase [Sulfodiicoccus acidiphilus]|uniref:Acyl-CoA dehydrogenase n=1 Tax=Sulfodiicoccus acidiphilus TaxID=1670455 RepID=A0A348B1G6_9CREN|nr:acyl-CoA dehydrogenase family protein [Sulfodiicoccus acidiphilus]BBD72018.1 acyl-CoA dehydrogenase [Sulfodiicoccus acidiphilus]GGT92138.1 acyl-CoA dehydrogenase [Sulfodiicoccus acidiphilus]